MSIFITKTTDIPFLSRFPILRNLFSHKASYIILFFTLLLIPLLILLSFSPTYHKSQAAEESVVIEAEDGVLLAPARKITNSEAAGNGAVSFENETTRSPFTSSSSCEQIKDTQNVISLTKDLSAGTYYLHFRVKPNSNNKTNFFFQVDSPDGRCLLGKTPIGYDPLPKRLTFQWISYNGYYAPIVITTTQSGIHTLKIRGQYKDVVLDRIILTRNNSCRPTGIGENCLTQAVLEKKNSEVTALYNSWVSNKIFGQIDGTQTAVNQVVGYRTFYPQGITVDRGTTPNKVYAYDSGNSRILGFSSIGTCKNNSTKVCTSDSDCISSTCVVNNNKKADIVIGQADEFHSACNFDNTQTMPASAASFCSQPYPLTLSPGESQDPTSMAVDKNHNLYIYDKYNHRALMYEDPFTKDTKADKVWGQKNFTERLCNQGQSTINASTLCSQPFFGSGDFSGTSVDVDPDGTTLWVVDGGNNRVLRFATNSTSANLVLGQDTFDQKRYDACIGSENDPSLIPTNKYLCRPKSVRVNPTTGQVFVIDWPHPDSVVRILIYDPPFTNGKGPTEVLLGGKTGVYPYNFNRSVGIEFDPKLPEGFWLSDWNNNRTIFLKKISGKWTITKVIGQPNTTSTNCGGEAFDSICTNSPHPPDICHACQSGGGIGIDTFGNHYVTDKFQNILLRFPPPIPDYSTTGISAYPANGFLFYSDPYQGDHPNLTGPIGTFAQNAVLLAKYPSGSSQLLLSDQYRVLFWNNYKTKSTGSPADGLLYQSTAESNIYKDGIISSMDSDSKGRIWIAIGEKVDVFQGPLTTNQQPLFSITGSVALRFGGSLPLGTLTGIEYDEALDALWVADTSNHRVVRISKPLDSSRQVDMVLGQKDAFTTKPNRGRDDTSNGDLTCPSLSADSFGNISKIRLDKKGNLFIADTSHEGWQCSNNRLLEYDAADLIPNATANFFPDGMKNAKRVYGARDFTTKADLSSPSPRYPFGIAFNSKNQMVMVVDGYGNDQNERVYWYNDPLPPCVSGCNVPHTAILPITAAQPADASFDSEDNLAILDHTWQRTLFFQGVANITAVPTQPIPTSTPTPIIFNSVLNGSFETVNNSTGIPLDWQPIPSRLTASDKSITTYFHSGRRSFIMTPLSRGAASKVLYQTLSNTIIKKGTTFSLSGWNKLSKDLLTTNSIANPVIKAAVLATHKDGSTLSYPIYFDLTKHDWQKKQATFKLEKDTVLLTVRIKFRGAESDTYFDDINIVTPAKDATYSLPETSDED